MKKLLGLLASLLLIASPAFAIGEYGAIYVGTGPSNPPAWSAQSNALSTPTVGTCGTSPSVSGNDLRGTITTGTGAPSACTLTFGTPLLVAPTCSIDGWGAAIPSITSVSTTAIVIGGTLGTSVKVSYICIQ